MICPAPATYYSPSLTSFDSPLLRGPEKKEEESQTAEIIEPSEAMPIEHVEAEVIDSTPEVNGTIIDAEVTE